MKYFIIGCTTIPYPHHQKENPNHEEKRRTMTNSNHRMIRSHSRAYTLLELIITFIIVSILLAIAEPSLMPMVPKVALTSARLSLVTLATGAQVNGLHHGRSVPNASDFEATLAAVQVYTPTFTTPTLNTNPTSVLADPPLGGGTPATSTVVGEVVVSPTATAVGNSGLVVPATGLAMLTLEGGCVMALVTPSSTTTWVAYSSSPATEPCSGTQALTGS